jgi:hypothetical protein
MTRPRLGKLLVAAAVLASAAIPFPLGAEANLHRVWAVKDCAVVMPAGPPLAKATVIVRDGLIEAVGPGLAVPPDAEVVDGAKLTVYPGLIDAAGQALLKFPEEKFDQAKYYSGDFNDKDRGLTPELRAFDLVNLGKATLEKYQKLGILAALALPDKGILTGQASVFSLSDPDKAKALLLKDSALGVGFLASSFPVYPSSLMGTVAFLRQEFSDTAYFGLQTGRWRKDMKGNARPVFNARYEVLGPFAAGAKPVVFLCRNQNDIRRALELASEFKLDAFVCDLGGEAFEVIPELLKAKARVLCTVAFKAPGTSLYAQRGKAEREKAEKEVYPRNAALLAEAGVPFAFSSFGTDDPKSFLEGVLKAVEAGLPREKALAALTATPAALFGLDGALGSVAPGKIANLILAEGELLAKDAKVRMVFADGAKVEFKEAKAGDAKPTVNVTGKWDVTAEGAPKLSLELAQEEGAVSGKLATPFGMFDFTGGSVSGKQVSFEINLSIGGQQIDLFFSAEVEGDTMRGTIVQGTSGSIDFTAKRTPA